MGWGSVSEDLKCKRLDEPPGALPGDLLLDLETNSAGMTATGASGVGCHSLSLGSMSWYCIVTLVGVLLARWCGVGGWLGIGENPSEMREDWSSRPELTDPTGILRGQQAPLGDLTDLVLMKGMGQYDGHSGRVSPQGATLHCLAP